MNAWSSPAIVPAPATPSVLQLRSSAGLYGADRMVMSLDDALRRQGARSRLLSIRNYLLDAQPLHEAASAAGHDAILLPCRGRIDMRTVSALRGVIDASAVDVLHAHDYKSAFHAWLATRGRRVRLVATLHGWVESSHALRLYNALELALLRRFDALVIVAESQRPRLLRAHVPSDLIWQIDNGIAIPPADTPPCRDLQAELGLETASQVFAAVARLSAEKNLLQLVTAFGAVAARDAAAVLLVVGDGPERHALQVRVDELGLRAQVRIAGERTDMARIYPLIDRLVVPSLSEGMPLVVLEAMAHGIPVIASAVGEIPRLLGRTADGCLVPPGDEAALRAALLAASQRGARRDVRAAAHVRAHHSAEAMAERYLALYCSLLAGSHDRKTA